MNSQIDYEMEQSRKLLLPKLFRVWKTLNKMMEDRGYVVEDNYDKDLHDKVIRNGSVDTYNEGEYLLSRVDKYCKDRFYGYKRTPSVKLLVSELGYDSGKIGAAALFFE